MTDNVINVRLIPSVLVMKANTEKVHRKISHKIHASKISFLKAKMISYYYLLPLPKYHFEMSNGNVYDQWSTGYDFSCIISIVYILLQI